MKKAIKRLFKSNYLFTAGVVICLFWIAAAILAPVIAPYDPIVQDLYRLMKPGSTLVVVGVYNPFKDWTIPDGSMIYAGQLLNFLYDGMNSVMRSYANDGVHDYVFVDVPDPEVISNTVNDMLSGQPMLHEGGWDPHPTLAGHQYIANQILTALGA